jgi:hypothetical protein
VKESWLRGLFLFSLVWSLGATLDDSGRTKFDSYLRQLLRNEIADHPIEIKVWTRANKKRKKKRKCFAK